jgi:hypothetical protein
MEKKDKIDYDALYALLEKRSITRQDIEAITGRAPNAQASIIAELSFRFPLYEERHGVYALNRM